MAMTAVLMIGKALLSEFTSDSYQSAQASAGFRCGHDPAVQIEHGFRIEEPPLTVPWGIDEDQLQRLFPNGLRRVTNGYYVASCTSLGGRRHKLGLHFRPDEAGRLYELEFFLEDAPVSRTFPDWQRRLVAIFGEPHTSLPGHAGYDEHVWRIGQVEIFHDVGEHFGPAESVRIRNVALSGAD
jgi:hypothetical protein